MTGFYIYSLILISFTFLDIFVPFFPERFIHPGKLPVLPVLQQPS